MTWGHHFPCLQPGSGAENSWCEDSRLPPLGCPLHIPNQTSFFPTPPWLLSWGVFFFFFLLTTEHTSQCFLYVHVAPRAATGSPGRKWLRILQAKNTHSLYILFNNKEGKLESNFYKACMDYSLSPKAVLFLYSFISSPKRASPGAVSRLVFDTM